MNQSTNPWGGNVLVDDTALLLSQTGTRCGGDCYRVIHNCFLEEGLCPDCYQKKHNKQSPALTRYHEQRSHTHTCVGGDPYGEAD